MERDVQISRDQRLEVALRRKQRVDHARKSAAVSSWRTPVEHLRGRRAVLVALKRQQQGQLQPGDLQAYADHLITDALVSLREVGGRFGSTRHRLHSEVDAFFDDLLQAAVDEAAGRAATSGSLRSSPRHWASFAAYRPNDLPELAHLLTPGPVRERIVSERAFVRAEAADVHMLTSWNGDWFLVQHAASGLRATFTPAEVAGVGQFGTVYAKHYQIADIDPDRHGPDPAYFEGLGIGASIYKRGAREFPGVRWRSGSYSDSARGLRARLHAEDPYTWAGPCDICDTDLCPNIWNDRDRKDFLPH